MTLVSLFYESPRLEHVPWNDWKRILQSAAKKKNLDVDELGVGEANIMYALSSAASNYLSSSHQDQRHGQDLQRKRPGAWYETHLLLPQARPESLAARVLGILHVQQRSYRTNGTHRQAHRATPVRPHLFRQRHARHA